MPAQQTPGYGWLVVFWIYGVICGLGMAATAIGILRGEALPGVIWPALTPLLVGPLLILKALGPREA
jgi:hypothetical protein